MWCFRNTLSPKESEQDRQHNIRRRVVEGCVWCGIEVRPREKIMVCGMRFERWTLCMGCYNSKNRHCTTPMYQETVSWEVDPAPAIANCDTVSAALEATLKVYHERPCLGYPRSVVDSTTNDTRNNSKVDSGLNYGGDYLHSAAVQYHWLSYGDVAHLAAELGTGLKTLLSKSISKIPGDHKSCHLTSVESSILSESVSNSLAYHRQTVILYAEASVEWYLMQYACILHRLLVVPILDGTPEHQLQAIMERCNPAIIITSPTRYSTVEAILSRSIPVGIADKKLPQIVIISLPSETPCCSYLNGNNTNEEKVISCDSYPDSVFHISDIFSIAQDVKSGLLAADVENLSKHPDIPVMLIPTSGSSGTPKLIMVSDVMMIRQFVAPKFGTRMVMYSFQPIRQSFDTLIKGGQIGMWSGDLGKLHQDMAILRPTHFGSTPVFWISKLQYFNAELRNEMLKITGNIFGTSKELPPPH